MHCYPNQHLQYLYMRVYLEKTCIPEEVCYTYTGASNTSLILNVELLNTVNHSIHNTFTTADILVLIKQVI